MEVGNSTMEELVKYGIYQQMGLLVIISILVLILCVMCRIEREQEEIRSFVELFEETDDIWNECNWGEIAETNERISETISEIEVEIRELKKEGK